MKLIQKVSEMHSWSTAQKILGKKIGFVPTMGALHEGHLSLAERSQKENDFTVLSIFVNPKQFLPGEDFEKYPRPLEKDLELCKKQGIDIVFNPSVGEIYSEKETIFIEPGRIGEILEGKTRPGHFRGVCTVVAKLFNLVQPSKAYFGLKDFQQLRIIEKMAEDLNFDTKIVKCETVREKDGLAMSSRNVYLNTDERKQASVLYKSLQEAKKLSEKEKNSEKIKAQILGQISGQSLAKTDYVEIVNAKTLEKVGKISGNEVICLAVWFGKTRLIDNLQLGKTQ
ncbi:MAG: pantoate--beta-alanine ligase [Candidatus Diapherotrites archaeon]|nr:pantoate--beta-alanine ligase [Candidatus Diapherotrites archaeon]